MDAKGKAIVAHITIIGWIVAIILNSQEKEEYASYYIRQTLGIFLLAFITGIFWWIPIIGQILLLIIVVLWVISLVYAAQGEMKPLPVIGEYFQEWFKSL